MPCSVLRDECIGEDDELSHDGSDGHFGMLSEADQTFVICSEGGASSRQTDSAHVECVSNRLSAATDHAGALLGAAVPAHRCNTGQGSDLLAIDGPKFMNAGDHGDRGHFSDVGNAGQDRIAMLHLAIAFNEPLQLSFQCAQVPFSHLDADTDLPGRIKILVAVSLTRARSFSSCFSWRRATAVKCWSLQKKHSTNIAISVEEVAEGGHALPYVQSLMQTQPSFAFIRVLGASVSFSFTGSRWRRRERGYWFSGHLASAPGRRIWIVPS